MLMCGEGGQMELCCTCVMNAFLYCCQISGRHKKRSNKQAAVFRGRL